jgi:hypothetical protein
MGLRTDKKKRKKEHKARRNKIAKGIRNAEKHNFI